MGVFCNIISLCLRWSWQKSSTSSPKLSFAKIFAAAWFLTSGV